jgi:hypothetical protein
MANAVAACKPVGAAPHRYFIGKFSRGSMEFFAS